MLYVKSVPRYGNAQGVGCGFVNAEFKASQNTDNFMTGNRGSYEAVYIIQREKNGLIRWTCGINIH
jgi:hypothetical protein